MHTIQVISPREIQRNYSAFITKTKRLKQPVYVGRKGKAEVIVLDVDEFRKLQEQPRIIRVSGADFIKRMEKFSAFGNRRVSALKALRTDRDQGHA
jgi:PHD/YefM family antitoxin component YafN of YafNO toxin-antitoxin module